MKLSTQLAPSIVRAFARIVGEARNKPTALEQEVLAQRRTEAALEQHADRERLFSAAVESSVDAIVTQTLDGIVTGWNPAAERLFGLMAVDAIGRNIDSIVPANYGAEIRAIVGRVAGGGYIDHQVTKRLSKNPKPVHVSLSVSPIKSPSGAVIGVCTIARDVSEQKRLDRLKDEFVATVSHELRTPLTSISGSLGLLLGTASKDLSPQALHLLKIALSNSVRLGKLINDILDIEKLESGKLLFEFKTVDIRSLIEQTVDANLGFAETYLVRLRCDIAAEGEVWVDPDRLSQVVTNLLSNAIKFSPPDGEVVVAVERRGEQLRLSVRDQGPGIPVEFKPRVFQKFAQAGDTNPRRGGGTGLGLSIVKEIVGRLGGEVGFTDAPGGGTIFYIDLPCRDTALACRPISQPAPADM